MEIRLNGELFTPDGKNMALYHYSGELACFNHIFLEQSRNDELQQAYGGFVWSDDPGFRQLHEFIVEYEYPLHLNQKEVKPSDEAAWAEKHIHDLNEWQALPPDWVA